MHTRNPRTAVRKRPVRCRCFFIRGINTDKKICADTGRLINFKFKNTLAQNVEFINKTKAGFTDFSPEDPPP